MKKLIMLWFTYFIILILSCGRAPIEPDPPDDPVDPCETCPPKPCEPVPCEPVPCDPTSTGEWVIQHSKDGSVPNTFVLLQNDVLVWGEVDNKPGSGEEEHRILGTYTIGDKMEAFNKGSKAGMRYWFEVDE